MDVGVRSSSSKYGEVDGCPVKLWCGRCSCRQMAGVSLGMHEGNKVWRTCMFGVEGVLRSRLPASRCLRTVLGGCEVE